MNILQVIASGGLGGREIQPLILAREMKKYKHNTFLLVRSQSATLPRIKKDKLPYFELPLKGYLNLFSLMPLIKILQQNKIDIIHTHVSKSLLFLHLARTFSGRKIKIIFTHRMGMNVKKNDIFHRTIYHHTDKIIAISQYVKRRMIQACPFLNKKIEIVYDGVFLPKTRIKEKGKKNFIREFQIKKSDITLGFVGQLNEGKGHFFFLEALKQLKEKYHYHSFKAFIIGEGELQQALKDKVREYHLDTNIIFTGFRWDLNSFYQYLDIFVVPSKSEAWGLVLLEAMSYGKSVICTDTGAFPEIVKNNINGLLVPYNDINRLAQALYRLIKSNPLRKKLGYEALHLIKTRFNYHNTVKHYLKIYKSVM